mmetsp:Transcript_82649/g.218129  ORF Transcript_82649/g.218129 Transcript_82649/m.218129 type:complete len:204 (+) Transcript_82649:196-807(+)
MPAAAVLPTRHSSVSRSCLSCCWCLSTRRGPRTHTLPTLPLSTAPPLPPLAPHNGHFQTQRQRQQQREATIQRRARVATRRCTAPRGTDCWEAASRSTKEPDPSCSRPAPGGNVAVCSLTTAAHNSTSASTMQRPRRADYVLAMQGAARVTGAGSHASRRAPHSAWRWHPEARAHPGCRRRMSLHSPWLSDRGRQRTRGLEQA